MLIALFCFSFQGYFWIQMCKDHFYITLLKMNCRKSQMHVATAELVQVEQQPQFAMKSRCERQRKNIRPGFFSKTVIANLIKTFYF